jgi:dipeptidyl aminopeptidase/acylaminoacyl peptidase
MRGDGQMPEQSRRPMEPRDLTRIRIVSDPQLCPEGRRVAYVVTTLSEERDEYLSQIWVVALAGGRPRRFTSGPKRDTTPRWSPDGTRLAFLSERERSEKPQLHVMPADGGEPVRLTRLRHGVTRPVWAPDGIRLAFVSRVGGWEEPEDETERQKSKPARVITTMKYKWNGEGFVYDRRPHLFVVAVDGGEPVQLTDGDFADEHPAWSPDGTLLAFSSARHPDRDHDNAADIWVVPAAGGEPRRVTDTAGPAGWPSFSPDGRTIAYLGHRHLNEVARNVRVYRVPVEGGPSTCLTAAFDRTCQPYYHAASPTWVDAGRALLVPVEDEGNVSVYRVDAAGNRPPERLIGGERVLTGFSVAGDAIAFAASGPVSPPEVFCCRADGSDERRLTDENRAWKATVALAGPERFRFERAGAAVDGWILRPPGFEPGRRYPVLLNIHGGPATQYGSGFFDEFQVYAGAGYGVLYLNPRGSQGYGEGFMRAVIGDWGGGDYADVMAGVDQALRRFDWIDPARLGVMGGSYGGFLTSWIVSHTDRFVAACSERALNTHYSMFGTSDIGHYFPEGYSGGHLPWENLDWYLEHSPLTYAKQIVTPLLIIHAEDDLRCPIEQAEQLFVTLKKQRKEVVLVRFPDENHELSRSGRPRHRLERFRILLEWFGRHLGPA